MSEILQPADQNHPWHRAIRAYPGKDIGRGIYMTEAVFVDEKKYPGAQVAVWSAYESLSDRIGPGVYILTNFSTDELQDLTVRSSVSNAAYQIIRPWQNGQENNKKELIDPPAPVDIALQLDNAPPDVKVNIALGIILNHVGNWGDNAIFEARPLPQALALEGMSRLSQGLPFHINRER